MGQSTHLCVGAVALGLTCGLVAAFLCYPSARVGLVGEAAWRAEWITYDYRLSYAPSLGPSPDVVLVTLDEETFSQPALSVWPFPRRFHAWVVNRLKQAGAKLIGVDMVLEGSSATAAVQGANPPADLSAPPLGPDDMKLAKAISRAGNVVLAMDVAKEGMAGKEGAVQLVKGSFPHPDFEDAALSLACVNLPRDLDDVVRRYWVSYDHQGEVIPTMGLALAAMYRGEDPKGLASRMLSRGRSEYPLLGGESILTRYRAPTGVGFTRIPYYRVLSGDFDPALVRGKIVLIGGSASLFHDVYATPVSRRGIGSGEESMAPMSGVEILANATDMVLRSDPVIPISPNLTSALTIAVSLVTAVLVFWLRPLKGLLLGWLPVCALTVLGTFEMLWMRTVWVPLIPLMLGATLSYSLGTVYLELTVEREQARLRRAWAKRVSPEVLRVILGNPGLTHVRGRRVTGTVFFSDLQGFTTFCHSCSPESVITQINSYLELATQVIRKHGGTVHKFIGDGVMAVFGDPVPQDDHALRAVAASVELQRKMAELRARQPEDGWAMFMRIGLHTGELVAGDIGPEDMLEYTVMGDTVSTASRLESLNKDFGTWIIMSSTTADHARHAFELEAHGQVEVRGRPEPLEIYTVREAQTHEES